MLGDQFGRMVSLGMEGKKVKLVVNVKGLAQKEWLNIVYQLVKGVANC